MSDRETVTEDAAERGEVWGKYSVPALAYLGDVVIEMQVREHLVLDEGLSTSAHLNARALDFVRAGAQAAAMKRLAPILSPAEEALYRRGRNIAHIHVPKNATMAEYRSATGMEVLFGGLWLAGKTERVHELFRAGYVASDSQTTQIQGDKV